TSQSLALYAGGQYDAWGVRGGVAQAWYRVHSDRHPTFGTFADHDTASYGADATQVFGEVGYSMALDRVALEPFAGLAYVNLHTDDFTESGGAAALQGDASSTGVGFSTLGVRAATDLVPADKGKVTAHGTIGWRHAFGSTQPTSTLSFAAGGGSAFGVAGVPIARDAAVLELGVDAKVSKRLTVGVSYSGQIGKSVRDHALFGNLLWKF
ncbi:autotransporter outer membrane beta-barrel domain-containing protein, partial [Ralstonia solanacearum]